MRASVSARRICVFWPFLLACSSPDNGPAPPITNVAPASGAGGIGAGGDVAGGGGVAGGGSVVNPDGGNQPNAGSGGAAIGGAPLGGINAGGSSSTGGGGTSSGGGGGGGGGAGTNAMCQTIQSEYAAALQKQLGCKLNTASQCTNQAAAGPGCECRVFIQPADPFAIENLSNVANGWFDADCSLPTCPAKCSTAATGTCQADAKSPLGGSCRTP